ncbi:MAG: DUF1552 domain-containing protein [Myxococcota bacterium]
MSSKPMNRRTVLQGLLAGAAVSVALPPLEAMLNVNGTALADGGSLPDRFGVWFWGNGVRPEHWIPSTTGAGYALSDALTPLAPVRDYVSVITGLEIKTATHPHHSGMTGMLTGDVYHKLRNIRDTIATTFARPSVDQLVAEEWKGQTPYRSLEAGVTRFRGSDEGSTFEHVSHNGPNDPNPAEYSARALYQRLFGASTARLDLVRSSVLDSVGGQIDDLERRLGAADRQRLDRHLTSVRELERRLDEGTGDCVAPPRPTDPIDSGREPIAEKNEVMSELLALALHCDLTRVFTLQFSSAGAGVVFWQVGATNSLHYTCHTEPSPQPIVRAATRMTMSQLASFLEALKRQEGGNGHVLDRRTILCTTELSDGQRHRNTEYPVLIAGKGCGRLRGDVHARKPGRNTSEAVLTALRGCGSSRTSFGYGAGRTTSVISELLT